MHAYRIYGLNISSEIEIPDLPETTEKPDVTIQVGQPADAPSGSYAPGAHRLSPSTMLFSMRDVGNYVVEGGSKVTVFPAAGYDPLLLRLFLLGSVSGMILHLNGLLPLHGNVIALDGEGCVAFLGHSGMGKSTLAAILMKRGYRLLSDDICAVKLDGDKSLVMPGIPHVRLWIDAMQMLRIDSSGLKLHHPSEEKFLLPLGDRYAKDPLPLRKIYILDRSEKEKGFRLEFLSPLEMMNNLRKHTYRLGFVKRIGRIGEHFSLCGEIARLVPVKMILRPNAGRSPEQFADFVERELNGLSPLMGAPG